MVLNFRSLRRATVVDLNFSIRKILSVLFGVSFSVGSLAGVDLALYKDLSETVASENYRLVKINIGDGGYGIMWDAKNKQFIAVGSGQGYKIKLDDRIEQYARSNVIQWEVHQEKFDPKRPQPVDLKTLYTGKPMSSREVAEHLNNLYKKADIYSDESGGVPKFYMYAESIWYYLDKYTKADFDQRTMEVLKKFSSSHEEKEFGAISLPAHRKTQYDFDYDWKNNKNIIRLDDFVRTGTQSSLTQYLPAVPTEKLGVGYFSLTHKNEVLRFKLNTQQAIFAVGKFWSYSYMYYPPSGEAVDVAILAISDPNNIDGNNGLYLLRKK
jgi:hypothetical protein